ncbi:DUF389 domain-containing protein [Pseudoxanthomonas mexicana]|nr:DUF389 domain-containing protein [Pseudoxanthomonas mexicana]UOV03281.1 DUF389 domain-containing protein [Pseudoxanthomonas mexicana]
MASAEALWRWLRQWRREHLQVDRAAVLRNVDEGGQLGPRYAFMTVMACGIATLGLLQNSVAVIIGAMLISPLMGPIVELGMSLATFDFRSLRESLKTLAVGTAVALTTATAIVLVSPCRKRRRRSWPAPNPRCSTFWWPCFPAWPAPTPPLPARARPSSASPSRPP